MSVSRVGDRSKRKKGGPKAGARGRALKDALPDIQPPARIKKLEDDGEGPAAENDEEDD
jgi:hypothetical protein